MMHRVRVVKARYRKSLRASELPAEWREAGRFAPDEQVTVTITAENQEIQGSSKRFIGAGKGLFASAREIDAYLNHNRNGWRS
jgi:hypothetical protein